MVLWGCFTAHKPPKALITKVFSPRDLRQPEVGFVPRLNPSLLASGSFIRGEVVDTWHLWWQQLFEVLLLPLHGPQSSLELQLSSTKGTMAAEGVVRLSLRQVLQE